MWNETGLHIKTSASTAGKRKKPLTGRGFRALSCITDDTAVLSRSRPPFLFASTTPAPCSGMAALGGSRHATKTTSTKSDRDKPVKKSLSPPSGTSGYQYVLYHVGKDHIAFCFAQRVFDLPGEFCYFLRFFGAGWSRRIVTDERSGENSFIFSFSRRSGVRR